MKELLTVSGYEDLQSYKHIDDAVRRRVGDDVSPNREAKRYIRYHFMMSVLMIFCCFIFNFWEVAQVLDSTQLHSLTQQNDSQPLQGELLNNE